MARRVLVTGGTSGIGRAVAARFVEDGCEVVVTGRRPETPEVARAIGATGLRLDLADRAGIAAVAEQVGELDVLVNNAGGFVGRAPSGPPDVDALADHWERTLRVNLVGPALLLALLEPRLRRGGAVVSIGSIGAEYAGNPYSVAKAALQAWSVGAAERLGPRDVTVNAIAPGYVAGTDLWGGPVARERHDALVARTYVGRAGAPEDVAALAFFLCSPGARHVTGQTIHLDGGAHTTR